MRKALPLMVLALMIVLPGVVRADTKLFDLQRMVVAVAVEEREPVGAGDLFAADLENIYAFIEAREIRRDTEVTMVWSRNGQEVSRVSLAVRQGPRWRTFSSITLANRAGDWRVELLDETGASLRSLDFHVR